MAAVTDNGVGADLYDVDARGRRAPHPLGILSHYDAVIWYTGDDYLTREPGQVPGTGTSRLALDEQLAVRDFINEGGKLLYAGKHAGQQYVEGFEFRNFGFPQPNEDKQGRWCDADCCRRPRTAASRTWTTSSSTTWGRTCASTTATPGWPTGRVPDPRPGSVPADDMGVQQRPPGDPGAGAPTATFGVTSSMIDRPAYQDSLAAGRLAPAGRRPFTPFTGSWFMASGHDDEAYKRLHTEVDLTGQSAGTLTFHDVVRPRAGLGPPVRGGPAGRHRELDDAAGRQRPHVARHGRQLLHGRRLVAAACAAAALPDADRGAAARRPARPASGTPRPAARTAGRTGRSTSPAMPARRSRWRSSSRLTGPSAISAPGSTTPRSPSAAATVRRRRSRRTPACGSGPAPAGTPNPDPQWTRTQQQFEEGGVVGTTDTVYAGFDLSMISTRDSGRVHGRRAARSAWG